MSRIFINYELAFILLSFFLVSCINAQTVDFSSDETVLAELRKIVDARNAELLTEGGKKLEAKSICIRRLKESAKVIVVGFFRTESGCSFGGAFINSRYFAANDFDLSKNALAAFGWEKANRQQREKLAKLWVEKGLLVFSPLPNQSLSAVSDGDGAVKVTASSKYPPGVTSRTITKEYEFDRDGKLKY